jgi:hypothetical protein
MKRHNDQIKEFQRKMDIGKAEIAMTERAIGQAMRSRTKNMDEIMVQLRNLRSKKKVMTKLATIVNNLSARHDFMDSAEDFSKVGELDKDTAEILAQMAANTQSSANSRTQSMLTTLIPILADEKQVGATGETTESDQKELEDMLQAFQKQYQPQTTTTSGKKMASFTNDNAVYYGSNTTTAAEVEGEGETEHDSLLIGESGQPIKKAELLPVTASPFVRDQLEEYQRQV